MLTHTETVKVEFSEEEIIKCLTKLVESKYYHVTYSNFNLQSAVFSVTDAGEYQCEIVYQKVVREDKFFKED